MYHKYITFSNGLTYTVFCLEMFTAAVDGGWSSYGSYGACSQTCGGGTKVKQRSCTNPSPANGGSNCTGEYTHATSCNTNPCREFYFSYMALMKQLS